MSKFTVLEDKENDECRVYDESEVELFKVVWKDFSKGKEPKSPELIVHQAGQFLLSRGSFRKMFFNLTIPTDNQALNRNVKYRDYSMEDFVNALYSSRLISRPSRKSRM